MGLINPRSKVQVLPPAQSNARCGGAGCLRTLREDLHAGAIRAGDRRGSGYSPHIFFGIEQVIIVVKKYQMKFLKMCYPHRILEFALCKF